MSDWIIEEGVCRVQAKHKAGRIKFSVDQWGKIYSLSRTVESKDFPRSEGPWEVDPGKIVRVADAVRSRWPIKRLGDRFSDQRRALLVAIIEELDRAK